jgi:hypothetical protein
MALESMTASPIGQGSYWRTDMITLVQRVVSAGAVVLCLLASTAMAQAYLQSRGTIESVDSQRLVLKTRDGTTMKVTLADDAHVFTLNKASLADVQPGSFVSITVKQQMDGSQKAQEVYIFPNESEHEPCVSGASTSIIGENEVLNYIEGPGLDQYRPGPDAKRREADSCAGER